MVIASTNGNQPVALMKPAEVATQNLRFVSGYLIVQLNLLLARPPFLIGTRRRGQRLKPLKHVGLPGEQRGGVIFQTAQWTEDASEQAG